MRRLIGRSQAPVKFNREQIYIYIKLRQPVGRDDGAYGWVNYCEIEEVQDQAGGLGSLRLASGYDLATLETRDCLERKLRLAQLVDEILPEKGEGSGFEASPHRPATYSDILLLIKKMEELEKILLALRD